MPAYQAGAARVSSTVTKRNPRPRKYASASERQAAYRDRAPEVCFRAEAKTVETLDRIAAKNDRSRAELLLSMTKFALANHDWARFGLTHKPLPYGYGLAEQEFVGPRLSNPSAYSDPALWEHSKQMAVERLGGHSARAMQLAGKIYRAAGGKYLGKRTKAQKSLEQWTAQDWTTKSGKPSRETGERYLPREVIEGLTPAEYGATTRAKRKGTAAGQQFVKQPKRIAAKVAALKANPTMKKPTPAQLAARARFAEMARSGAFKRKAKTNPAKKTVSEKISQLTREGFPQKQAVAIALEEQRRGKVKATPRKRNPTDMTVAQTILAQLGGGKFIAMTGAKNFIGGTDFLGFTIPKNMSPANRVTISYSPGRDLYRMSFIKASRYGLDSKEVQRFEDVYADQLRDLFTQVTGMETSLGTLGRKTNPRAGGAARRGRKPSIKVGDYVRSYDFPGTRDDFYLEGVVTKIGNGVYLIDVSRRIVEGMEKPVTPSLRQVQAPIEPNFFTGVYGVQKLTRMDNPRAANPATGTKKSRTKLNPKPRMAKIAWLTPGGQREVMEVPIDFAFKEYIGNIQEDFFARTDDGFLVVTEKSTGMRVGQVPHTMRAAALNDKAAAKQFVQSIAEKVGAPAFRAAIAKHPRIA